MSRKKKENSKDSEQQPEAKKDSNLKEFQKTVEKAETTQKQKLESETHPNRDRQGEGQKDKEETASKKHEPQMVTVNGQKITHGHAYQSNLKPEDWYFTAKIDGQQLKPQKMDPSDLVAYQKKEMTVQQLMERYYPTKLMPKVPEAAFAVPNVITGPSGALTIDKFNVYKEKDEASKDYGKYKFYAQVGEVKLSTVAARQDLNAYFDRVVTPSQLVEKVFGEKLHLPSHYKQYSLPDGVDPAKIHISKDRKDKQWKVMVDLGEYGKTSKQTISFDDGFSHFKAKSASREQIAAKYLNDEIKVTLNKPLALTDSRGQKI